MVLNTSPEADYEDEDWEPEEDEGDAKVSAREMLTDDRKVRVHRARCGTCIYWPENRMHLKEGARDDMEARADADNSWIVCHQTLPGNQYGAPPAVCHGYYQHGKATSWPLRWAAGSDMIEKVPPPCTRWEGRP